jgi:hypothetical protein
MTIGDGIIVRTALPLQDSKRIPQLSAANAAWGLMRFKMAAI